MILLTNLIAAHYRELLVLSHVEVCNSPSSKYRVCLRGMVSANHLINDDGASTTGLIGGVVCTCTIGSSLFGEVEGVPSMTDA